jgi:rubrerythrin
MWFILDVVAYSHRRFICRLCGWLKREDGHNWTDWADPPACRFCGTTKKTKKE